MDSDKKDLILSGYKDAYKLAKHHYENFPVISFFLPSSIKKDTSIIYWFARTADDYADEGNLIQSERLRMLGELEKRFTVLLRQDTGNNLEMALRNTVTTKNLSVQHFYNLIKAFKQDVTKKRYTTFTEVLDYCSCSANPVGRIMLELLNTRNEKAFFLSDKICTALQLTNFIQDTELDYRKGRIYFPQVEMDEFGVSESVFELKKNSLNFKKLLEFSVSRIQSMFNEGKALLGFLSGRFKYEIDWTIRGGEKILSKIRGADFDIFTRKQVLTKTDHIKIILKMLIR